MKRKVIYSLMVLFIALSAVGCTNNDSQKNATESTGAEREKLDVWYVHSGAEAEVQENAISKYNSMQEKYEAVGLSVSDKQKIIVAMSGSDAPDAIICSNQDVIAYAGSELLTNISELDASDDTFALEDNFSAQAIATNTINGNAYAVPHSSMIIQMFYNKDILEELGYEEPPKTMEELFTIAVEATELDENGNITRVGYPLFPLASARQELIYAFSGAWWNGNDLTPDDPNILDSLNMNMKYRDMYGIDKVQQFTATANTNRYTENDMFFAGKQLFRFDGPWLAAMTDTFNSDVNYGVALIPGIGGEETMGRSRYETNGVVIPVVADQKEGAWDFAKTYSTGEIIKEVLIGLGNLPCQPDLYEDPDILALPNYPIFIEALKAENGILYPTINDLAKYTSLIEEHLDYVYNGIMTPEEAMTALKEQSETLK
ncbi:MAG: extracellular solute-binding protein [Lachnospirales bacterium]